MIKHLVEPVRAERRAVAAFVPAGVRRGVDGPVHQEGGDRPPRAPGDDGQIAAGGQKRKPEAEVPEPGTVAAPHDLSHLLAGQFRLPPGLLQPLFDAVAVQFDSVLMTAGKAVIALNRLYAHGWSPFISAQIATNL